MKVICNNLGLPCENDNCFHECGNVEFEEGDFKALPHLLEKSYIYNKPYPRIRKEVHTRTSFAHDIALEWLKRLNGNVRGGGNIMSCKQMRKILQARRIYVHYTQEYQNHFDLPIIF